ncbi:MAG: hypothetical protein WD403_12665, partial [Pirellulales bacterium]
MIKLMAMPPTLGMAIGCITSEPRPWVRKIGIKPMTVVAVEISSGRTRFKPACITHSRISSTLLGSRPANC